MPGQGPIRNAFTRREHCGVLDDCRGVLNIVDTEKPTFQLAQNSLAVPVRAAQERHQIATSLDPIRTRNSDRGEYFAFTVFEGRILLLESLILFVETDALEPEIESALRHPYDHSVDGLWFPGLENLKETTLAWIVTWVDGMNTPIDVGFEIVGIDPIECQNPKRFIYPATQRIAGDAKLPTLSQLVCFGESEQNLTQQRHVLVEP